MISPENSVVIKSSWNEAFIDVAGQMYAIVKLCPRRALLACSTVNPRHPLPPDHLDLIAIVMNPSGRLLDHTPTVLSRFVAFVRSVGFAARETARIAYVQILFHAEKKALFKEPARVVLKTWFFSIQQEDGSDFYFGLLPQLLREKGLDCILIGGNAGKSFNGSFTRGLLGSDRKAVPELALIPIWGPFAVLLDQVLTSLTLSKLMRSSQNLVFTLVAARASLECLKPATLKNALHFFIAKRAVEIWKPKIYGTLFEGQPWEKIAWLGAKSGATGCLTMGYQHTVVMPHSWGLINPNLNSWEFSAPDIVLALGPTTQEMMKSGHKTLGTDFITFGSFRRMKSDFQKKPPIPSQRVVLVVPEGLMEEATLLFERAIQTSILVPDHHFVFRCHPVLPFELVRHNLSQDITKLPNVEVSTFAAIEEDFTRSSVLLYRGSSVVLYGVLAGLKPIYFNEPDRPYVDPLFQLGDWRESVDSVIQLAESLRKFASIDAERAQNEQVPAQAFVNQYCAPVSKIAIHRFMKTVR